MFVKRGVIMGRPSRIPLKINIHHTTRGDMASSKNIVLDDHKFTITFADLELSLHPTVHQYFTDRKNVKSG